MDKVFKLIDKDIRKAVIKNLLDQIGEAVQG